MLRQAPGLDARDRSDRSRPRRAALLSGRKRRQRPKPDENGWQDEDISQSQCLFCHSEPANPQVAAAISDKGYFIIKLQGFEE